MALNNLFLPIVLAFKLQGYSLSTVKIGEKLAEDGVRSRVTVYNRSSVYFVYTVRYSFPMAVLKRICLKVSDHFLHSHDLNILLSRVAARSS